MAGDTGRGRAGSHGAPHSTARQGQLAGTHTTQAHTPARLCVIDIFASTSDPHTRYPLTHPPRGAPRPRPPLHAPPVPGHARAAHRGCQGLCWAAGWCWLVLAVPGCCRGCPVYLVFPAPPARVCVCLCVVCCAARPAATRRRQSQ